MSWDVDQLVLHELRTLRNRAFPDGVANLAEPDAVDGLWHLLDALDRRIEHYYRRLNP